MGDSERFAGLDWLSFTLPDPVGELVLDQFPHEVRVNSQGEVLGALGYSISARLPEGGLAAWGGNNDTMHFSLPAGCLGWMRQNDVDLPGIIEFVCANGHFTRVDVAFDDRSGAFTVADFADAWFAGEVVSRFRSWRRQEGGEGRQRGGVTFYLGSGSSDSQVRVYDKRLERGLDPAVEPPWIRVEFQGRGDVADRLGQLVRRGGLSELAAVVSGYVQWRVPSGDSNKSRWPVADHWAALLGVVRSGLGLPGPRRTLGRAMGWVETGVGTTLAAVREAVGPVAFVDWLHERVLSGVDPGAVRRRRLEWGVV